jgi:hypothetical protein
VEKFLADLRPDLLHVSTLFEGFHNEVVASVGRLNATVPIAVTLYDLIPFLRPESFLADGVIKRWYLRRVHSLRRADLLLAISESSRREAIEALQISPHQIVTISAGVEEGLTLNRSSRDEQATLLGRHGFRHPFVLSSGTSEPHKNLEGHIMLELGAGWAPWCVIGYLAAKQRGVGNIKLVAVEADAGILALSGIPSLQMASIPMPD